MEKTRKILTLSNLIILSWSIILVGIYIPVCANRMQINDIDNPSLSILASPKANFTGSYTSYAYDADSDTLFDELHITVEVSVYEIGRYRVYGWVRNPITDEDHHFSSNPSSFTSLGIYSLLFTIPGSWIWSQHATTSYILDYIYLIELDENDDWIAEWDYAYTPYTTITCNSDDFVTPSAYFTGYFVTSLLDTDTLVDGLADFLALDIEVQVDNDIDIEIQVELDLETGNHWNCETFYGLSSGAHLLRVNFAGQLFYLTSETRNYTFNFKLVNLDDWEQIDSYIGFQSPYFDYQDFTPPGAGFSGYISDQGIDTDADGTFNYVKLEIELEVIKSGLFRIAGYIQADDGWYDEYFDTEFTFLEVGTHNVIIDIDRHFFYSQTSGSPIFISELFLWQYFDDYGDLEIEYVSTKIYLSGSYYYHNFDPQNARIIDIVDDYGIDFDSDGKYDLLRVVFSLEVTVQWIDLELVAELQTNSTGELYTAKSSRFYGLSSGIQNIFLDFPCNQLYYSEFNDTLVISHYHLYQLNKDYKSLDIESNIWILTGKYNYLNFSSIEPDIIEIRNIWPESGTVHPTDSWIGVGVEVRKFGSADVASVDITAYLEGTPYSLTFIEKNEYEEEEYWNFDLLLDQAGIWSIEVVASTTIGPSASGRIIVLVSSPSTLNEISFNYPSLMIGGTLQITTDIWDLNGIDSVYLLIEGFSEPEQTQMDYIGTSSQGEIYSGEFIFNEIGEYWIEIKVINKLGLSTHVGIQSILVLDEPEIIDVDVSPSKHVEPGTEITVEVDILKSNVAINKVSLSLLDDDMKSIEYILSFTSETEEFETYSIEFSLDEQSDYECTIEVSNTNGQSSTYIFTIVVEGEETEVTISPAFEYLFIIGSLILLIRKRKFKNK